MTSASLSRLLCISITVLSLAHASPIAAQAAGSPTAQPGESPAPSPAEQPGPEANASPAAQATPEGGEAAQPVATASPVPVSAAPAPRAPASPSRADESPDALPQRVDALEQQLGLPSHLKFSGFVQAQYVRNDTSKEGLDTNGKPLNKNEFEVRRARFRATYTADIAELLINVDAIPSGVTVKEAEASVFIPWTDLTKTKVTAGLFYMPFGYEVQESDSVLPFVERTTAANRLLPGSRDLGLRVQGELFQQIFVYQLAVMNGNPISDAVFPGLDPNGAKDFLGRLGVHVGDLRFGVSGLIGQGYLPPVIDDPKTTTVDESHPYRDFGRRAAAFDVTYRVELPVVGELALYAEGTLAHDLDRSRLTDYPKYSAGGVVDANQLGAYVGFVQHLGEYVALGARGEVFDPSTSKSGNTLESLMLVAHFFPHPAVRLTTAYQLSFEKPKLANNAFWLRAQVKF